MRYWAWIFALAIGWAPGTVASAQTQPDAAQAKGEDGQGQATTPPAPDSDAAPAAEQPEAPPDLQPAGRDAEDLNAAVAGQELRDAAEAAARAGDDDRRIEGMIDNAEMRSGASGPTDAQRRQIQDARDATARAIQAEDEARKRVQEEANRTRLAAFAGRWSFRFPGGCDRNYMVLNDDLSFDLVGVLEHERSTAWSFGIDNPHGELSFDGDFVRLDGHPVAVSVSANFISIGFGNTGSGSQGRYASWEFYRCPDGSDADRTAARSLIGVDPLRAGYR